jgi:hypothetical protein
MTMPTNSCRLANGRVGSPPGAQCKGSLKPQPAFIITHYSRSNQSTTHPKEGTMFDSPAWARHSTAQPRQCHCQHLACLRLIASIGQFNTAPCHQPHPAWPWDLLLTFWANNWSALRLFSSQQPTVQFYIMQPWHQSCQPYPPWSRDLLLTSPTNKRTNAKPLHLTDTLMYDLHRLK